MSIRFQVGDVARHTDSSNWRTVKHICYNSKGEQLVGFGRQPVGFSMAKDLILQEPVQLKFNMKPETREGFGKNSTLLDHFCQQNPVASAMMLDGFMDKDVDSMCDGIRMFMTE